jgi:hypothetical protein
MPFRIWVLGAALALAASAAVAQEAPPGLALNLHLHCAAGKTDPTAGPTGDQVLVDVLGDLARIRIPSNVLPAKQGGGEADWKPISDLQVDDHLITGHVGMGFLNKPSLTIDRMSGRIDVGGAKGFGFHGNCAAYDQNAAPKF